MPLIKKIKLAGEDFARDIGAMSSNVVYDGDEGKTSPLNEKIRSIFTAIENINSFEVAIVNGLPSENIDDHTIYFVPEQEGSSTYNEYMYVNNRWELIGTTTIDLSNYLQKSDISVTQIQATGTDIGSITIDGTTTTFKAPTVDIPEQEQSDWLQTDSTAPSFIQDKPSIWEKDDHSVNINEQTSRNEGLYSVVEGSHTGTITRNVDPEDREAEAQEYQAGIDGNNYAHLEGQDNYLGGDMAHVEGYQNIGYGEASHVEGSYNYNDSDVAHIEGTNNINYSWAGHIEGNANIAYGSDTIHVEGYNNKSNSYGSHTEGNDNVVIDSDGAHVEGYNNELTNGSNYAHVEGDNHTLSGSESSHVEGNQHQLTDATYTHVEGQGNEVNSTSYSHVEGYGNVVYDSYAHVEGHNNESNGQGAHVEGENNYIDGDAMYAHVEGSHSESNGYYSHAEGEYNSAYARAVHVFGRANQYETVNSADQYGTYVEIVGNGIITNGAVTQRSNARTLDWNGNEVLAGKLTLGTGPVNNMDAATKGYVDTAISDSIDIIDDGLADVAQSGDYNDLINRPTQLSDLTNDVGFITSSDIPTTVSSFTNDAEYITAYDIPTTVSSFTNDSGYITSDDISITRYISEGDVLAEIAVGNTTTELYVPHPFEFDEFDLDLSSYTIAQLSQGIIYPNSGLIEDITSAFQSNKTKLNVYLKTYINDTSSCEIVATAEGQQFDITMDGSTLSDVMKFTFAGSYVNSESDALVPPILVGSLYIVPVQNMIMLVSTNVGMLMDDVLTYISGQEFATQSWVSDNYATQTWVQDQGYITSTDLPTIPTNLSDLTDDIGVATLSDIPTVPTNVSELNNDAGYIADLSVNQILASGTAIGSIDVNGVTTTFYAPSQSQQVTEIVDLGNIEVPENVMNALSLGTDGSGQITLSPMPDLTNLLTKDLIFKATLTYQSNVMGTMLFRNQNSTNQGLETYKLFSCDLALQTGSSKLAGRLNLLFDDTGDNTLVFLTSQLFAPAITEDNIQTWISNQSFATESWVTSQGYASSSDIPTNVSELTNDAGYITSGDISAEEDPVFTTSPAYSIAQTDIDNWNNKFYVVEIEITSTSPLTLSFVNQDDSYTSILDKVEAGAVVYLSLGGSTMSQVTDVNYTQNIINFRSIYYENNSLSYYNFQIHSNDTITLDEHLHIPTTAAPTYSLSMTGPTITLTPSSGTASTITLPIWDGTLD